MPSSGSLPLSPPPSSRHVPSTRSSFFLDLVSDLNVRIEWLEQVIDAVPEPQASSGALALLRAWAKALDDVHRALAQVQAHLHDPQFKKLFVLDGPLAAFLSRLYGWCEEVSTDFEALAVKLRRNEPVLLLFPQRKVHASFHEFHELTEALKESLQQSRPVSADSRQAWTSFDADFEELLWATEWMHMNLAKSPGG